MSGAAQRIMRRLRALGQLSDEPGCLTRTYGSDAMRRANNLVAGWMRESGMAVHEDAVGNLIGHYKAARPKAKTLVLGSHLDTVRNAGAFDGPLGVVLALECIQHLRDTATVLPFAIDVIGFCDEEGMRFQTTYLGSRALAGTLTPADLARTDATGISLAEAIRIFGGDPDALASAKREAEGLLAYAEVHIEQGPVLEEKDLSVGVVTAIAGQSRISVGFQGRSGHAGTTPMHLRRDALAGAAEWIAHVEELAKSSAGLVATVGQVHVLPNASNVIPGEVTLTLDIRHPDDPARLLAVADLRQAAHEISGRRGLELAWRVVQETRSVSCDPDLGELLTAAVLQVQGKVAELASGAGHDAAVMAAITPSVMLFVRCKDGLSHHPDETASVEDIAVALEVMNDFIQRLAAKYA